MVDPEVVTLLEAVPEFLDHFLQLVEAVDGDPGPVAAFTELADFVASVMSGPVLAPGLLARCFAAVERVACESREAEELVGWAFLDSLCPEDLDRLAPWLGPHTAALREVVDADGAANAPRADEMG